jgi:nucleolar protein 9
MAADFNGNDGEEDAGGYNRPRRPSHETIAYLRGLPLDIQASTAEITNFLDPEHPDNEFPQCLAAAISAIDEVRHEIASLAGDEHGSQCLEVLANIAAPYSETAARILLHACSGYHLHLATHRYGSHVVQSILQLAVASSCKEDLALYEDSPQFSEATDGTLPSLTDLILEISEEISPNAPQLAIHVCGSHVLRTLLCVLGGVNLVSSPGGTNGNKVATGAILRGRKKGKKKKKKKPVSSAEAPHAGTMHIVYLKDSRVSPDEFSSALDDLNSSLIGKPTNGPGELQQLSIHPSAGPLLIVLLRVLTYISISAKLESQREQNKDGDDVFNSIADFRLGISRKEPKFEIDSPAHALVKRLLCWQESTEEQQHTGAIIYGLSGEPRGSHLLETMLRLSPDSVYESIVKYGDFDSPTSLQEYVEHEFSNFVIQTLLSTIRSKEMAESMLEAVEKVISSGLATNPHKRRRGILWRAVELAAKFRVGQESILKAIRIGFGATNAEEAEGTAGEDGKKEKNRKKDSAVAIKDCIPKLINITKPESDGGRAVLDVSGSRSVYHLLRFSPRLCDEVLSGITEGLTQDELQMIAKDGLGSRCIMDGILDGPVKTPIFAAAVKNLFGKLQSCWVGLASDRVGHHTAMKMFAALPRIDDKVKLVEELSTGGNRLGGTAMGRSVAELCLVDEYQDSKKSWRQTVSRMLEKEDKPLEEMIPGVAAEKEGSKDKSKRKRKRKRADNKTEEQEEEAAPKKVQQPSSKFLSVDSIMNAMSIPK